MSVASPCSGSGMASSSQSGDLVRALLYTSNFMIMIMATGSADAMLLHYYTATHLLFKRADLPDDQRAMLMSRMPPSTAVVPSSIEALANDMTSTRLPSPGQGFPFVLLLGVNARSPILCIA